jgi:thiamine-phosphate pyrophosphorylase
LGSPAAAKEARGPGALRSARRAVGERIALYALGGVTPERAPSCAAAGADGVAVLRALLASPEPARLARALHDAFAPGW